MPIEELTLRFKPIKIDQSREEVEETFDVPEVVRAQEDEKDNSIQPPAQNALQNTCVAMTCNDCGYWKGSCIHQPKVDRITMRCANATKETNGASPSIDISGKALRRAIVENIQIYPEASIRAAEATYKRLKSDETVKEIKKAQSLCLGLGLYYDGTAKTYILKEDDMD